MKQKTALRPSVSRSRIHILEIALAEDCDKLRMAEELRNKYLQQKKYQKANLISKKLLASYRASYCTPLVTPRLSAQYPQTPSVPIVSIKNDGQSKGAALFSTKSTNYLDQEQRVQQLKAESSRRAKLRQIMIQEKRVLKSNQLAKYLKQQAALLTYHSLKLKAKNVLMLKQTWSTNGFIVSDQLHCDRVSQTFCIRVGVAAQGKATHLASEKVIPSSVIQNIGNVKHCRNLYLLNKQCTRILFTCLTFIKHTDQVLFLQRWIKRVNRKRVVLKNGRKLIQLLFFKRVEICRFKLFVSVLLIKSIKQRIYFIQSIDYPRPRAYRVFFKKYFGEGELQADYYKKLHFIAKENRFIEYQYYQKNMCSVVAIQNYVKHFRIRQGLKDDNKDKCYVLSSCELVKDSEDRYILLSLLTRREDGDIKLFVQPLFFKVKTKFLCKSLTDSQTKLLLSRRGELKKLVCFDFANRTLKVRQRSQHDFLLEKSTSTHRRLQPKDVVDMLELSFVKKKRQKTLSVYESKADQGQSQSQLEMWLQAGVFNSHNSKEQSDSRQMSCSDFY